MVSTSRRWRRSTRWLARDARNPQARFLKGVVQTDQEELDDAAVTFIALTEDFPELPEPQHKNLAVIWRSKAATTRQDRAGDRAERPSPTT